MALTDPARAVTTLRPGQTVDAVVRIPGSKSLTNRALVLSALATGDTLLRGGLVSEDSAACAQGLEAMGVHIQSFPDRREFRVRGAGAGPRVARARVDVGLSGTTARFLVPYAALGVGQYHFDGVPRMRERPMGPLTEALRAQGVRVEGGPNLPLTIHGAGQLQGGDLEMAGGDTSQPASGMLMAAPFAARDLVLRVRTHRAALPFVHMTVSQMAEFGVACAAISVDTWRVPAGARYAPGVYEIEPDASAAAYFWALAAITGGRVRTPGIGRSRMQGDAQLLEILAEMGCVVRDEGGAEVVGPKGGLLRHGTWDCSAMADQALTVAVLGLFGDGPTRVRNVGHIRLHETDRIAAAVGEISRLGGRCEAHDDGFTVWPLPEDAPLVPVTVATHNDHRVAMAFALVGLRRSGIAIQAPAVVAKTFPEFFDALARAAAGPPGAP